MALVAEQDHPTLARTSNRSEIAPEVDLVLNPTLLGSPLDFVQAEEHRKRPSKFVGRVQDDERKQVMITQRAGHFVFALGRAKEEPVQRGVLDCLACRLHLDESKRREESLDVVGDDGRSRLRRHDGIERLDSEGFRLADQFENSALGGKVRNLEPGVG